ncbi:retrovirus-related pol polyprotein from transposon TNT 1-94 [Tanacetum coccineum]
MSFIKRVENQNDIKVKQLRTDNGTEFRNNILVNFCDEKGISPKLFLSLDNEPKWLLLKGKIETLTQLICIRTMLSGFVFSKQYWTEAIATSPRPSKSSTQRQQTEETYHITFDEIPDAIKFLKPSVDNINIAENKRYSPDEYLHPYEPSQRYQTNNNDVSFIEPYECPEPVVLETEISEHSSSPRVEDTSVQNTIPIPNPPLPIPSVVTPAPQDRWSQDKHIELVNIIGNPGAGILTRSMDKDLGATSAHECLLVVFLSEKEPKKVSEALQHPGWVDAMQDELNQFTKNKVWTLVPAPYAQGYNQQEGIDYDETFDHVARLEANRIFLAFATYMNFIVYQMDVKSAFLNGKLKEEVYVKQPPGFESNEFPNHVCKLDKALYGLKQAPRAWICWKKYDIDDSLVKIPMVSPNNLGPDLSGKAVNETQYRDNWQSHMCIIHGFRPCAGVVLAPLLESLILGRSLSFRGISDIAGVGSGGGFGDAGLERDQIDFTFEEIAFTTNNEVALLYPSYPNSEYFREVSDFISKCCLKEAFIKVSTPTCGIRGDIGINTFRIAIRAHYLPHSSMYVSTSSITIVRPWFETVGGKIGSLDQISNKDATILYCLANGVKIDCAKLIWEDIIHKLSKKTREKVVPYPRFISLILEYMMPEFNNEELTINPTQVFSVYNWALNPNQTEGPPFTDHLKAIYNLDVPVDSKSPKPSLQTEEVPQGKKPGAKIGLRRKQSSKHIFKSKTEAFESKPGQSEKETQSSLAKDKSPSHPSPPTPVVGEMHKEAQQAAGGPTFLGATSKEGAHPQLSSGHDASVDSTAEVDPGLSAHNDSILAQHDQTKSRRDELKITHADSGTNEESRADDILKKIKLEDLSYLLKDTRFVFFTHDSPQDEPIIVSDGSKEEEEVSKDNDIHASSHDSQKDELEQQKAKVEAKVAPLKARPSYPDINQLTNLLVISLKPEFSKLLASHDFASCLPDALKELPSKFTKLSGEIKELKKHVQDMEIELPEDLKEIPTNLETFTSTISSLSSPEQYSLGTFSGVSSFTKFATVVENALGAITKGVPSTGQATTSPAKGEKNTNPATTDAGPNLHDELVDLLGIDVVTREDGTSEVISNVKVSDLHLAEWREVVQACLDRKEKGWKTIYGLIKTRMEYLDQTEKELKIDFNKPLKKQDPLNELNDLANKKRKRTGDSTDHSRSTKKHKSSVQHEEEVLRRLESIFTSVYAAVQKLKKAFENQTEDVEVKENEPLNKEIINIKESKDHPIETARGNLNERTLRSQVQNQSNLFCFVSSVEPKNIKKAIKDKSWTIAMQEELNQFVTNDVWSLVPPPENQTVIGTKWIFKNKLDENGVVSRNKARLVAQGYNQQEGIDFDETYALVARLESIRILLIYACAYDFKLFQMDVKSAYLNSFINEEVYVSQPPDFINFEKPNHVFKLKKALYGLKQAPNA